MRRGEEEEEEKGHKYLLFTPLSKTNRKIRQSNCANLLKWPFGQPECGTSRILCQPSVIHLVEKLITNNTEANYVLLNREEIDQDGKIITNTRAMYISHSETSKEPPDSKLALHLADVQYKDYNPDINVDIKEIPPTETVIKVGAGDDKIDYTYKFFKTAILPLGEWIAHLVNCDTEHIHRSASRLQSWTPFLGLLHCPVTNPEPVFNGQMFLFLTKPDCKNAWSTEATRLLWCPNHCKYDDINIYDAKAICTLGGIPPRSGTISALQLSHIQQSIISGFWNTNSLLHSTMDRSPCGTIVWVDRSTFGPLESDLFNITIGESGKCLYGEWFTLKLCRKKRYIGTRDISYLFRTCDGQELRLARSDGTLLPRKMVQCSYF